ncbi:hypothetical protein AKJ16_DCAP05664 [Drosera capensis]
MLIAVRLSEIMYSLHHAIKSNSELETLDAFLGQVGGRNLWASSDVGDMIKQAREQNGLSIKQHTLRSDSPFFGCSVYIDPSISSGLRNKVVEAITCVCAVLIDQWFVGCSASYVVSEQSSIQRYLGHADNIVTPMWFLKASRERSMQRCVDISADLAKEMHILLRNMEESINRQEACGGSCSKDTCISEGNTRHEERLQAARHAKLMVRNRRLQRMQIQVHPIFPNILLHTICWSVSDPTSTAAMYIDTSFKENVDQACLCPQRYDNEVEESFANLCRPLAESEKKELILKHHFLTLLFPVDRFGEMGPATRTYFSDTGFECLHVLDLIYGYYQESMTVEEVEAAIHTDSRQGDELRSAYSNALTAEAGRLMYRHIDFVGSRRSFEMLKRVSIDNCSTVYELILRK